MEKLQFSWYDYGLFGTMILLSTSVGIYFGFIKKQNTSQDYLLGGREMATIPVAASLIVGYVFLSILPFHK